ncbi:diguanylate phosphodiesterase [Lachnospiraceae bacterium]|uniref:putative bifunctional diguanylate cyclase/phosphodiesterase n=1 Tax=Extibacter sp. GGCC_0201 TaxID=2731209 RepID=UPI001FB8167F|nr:bifunctional diguanylate cyclase/phosphodiesterase [Extibacter sp. GGCC_0201]BDF32299.1 diguanylate phosphodiesterase [Lachnospiraceae bacterium]BDF36309.1 diguanylate phosphodiesterase [Lachnospiraceae bacterium]
MKKIVKLGFPLIVAVILIMSFLSARSMSDIENYGRLINYVGIVRGASQRVIKLETNDMPDDNLINYVSSIMDELLTGEGEYGLERTGYGAFNDNLEKLGERWEQIKTEIAEVRSGHDKEKLLASSEELFDIANDTVFSIEKYSGMRSASLARQLIVMGIFCFLISIVIIGYYVREYFRLRKKTETLADMAGRDKLTGALTTERFYTDAQKMLDSTDARAAILYIDFENFKYINDVFGYEVGDAILQKYAEVMTASLGKGELLARVMADRFVLLRFYEDKELMLEEQKELDRRFMNLDVLPDKHSITIACGFCCREDVIEQLDINGLINRANYAQKTIKNKPDVHYAFYDDSIRQKMFREIYLTDRLQKGLDTGEFRVYLQPKVSPFEGRIEGAEALIRWITADGEFITPGEFITLFEKNHSIRKLDQYVFESVCRLMHERYEKGRAVVPVSVNVSKLTFYTADFIDAYKEIKERYGIPDNMLEIEFTETVACENEKYMTQIVKDLHENGFLCSMDDFGTGYSSLGMLKNLDIDTLKLDALFFRESKDLKKEQIIVKEVLHMIYQLNIKAVAEGIETESQVAFLKECGCDYIQGYYYYKPMPAEEFGAELDRQSVQAV